MLITGGTGFIGKNLINFLKEDTENQIFAFFRNKDKIFVENEINWINHDFSKEDIFPNKFNLLPKEIDIIVHLAQSRNYKNFPEESNDIFNVNLKSTFELLEYGRKVGIKSFIYASSGAVYPPMFGKEQSEESEVKISNFYAFSKYASELMIKQYKSYFNTIILRLFFPYGPGQRGMLMPNLIENVKNKKPISLLNTENGIKINPIYIDDVAKAIIKAINLEGENTINIAGSEIVSIKHITKVIGSLVNQEPIFSKDSNSEVSDVIGSIKKMQSLLNFTPEINLKDGLAKMVRM